MIKTTANKETLLCLNSKEVEFEIKQSEESVIRLLTRERQRGEQKNLGSLFVDVKACSSQTHSKTTSGILYNVLSFISVIETNWSCSLTYLQAWLHANVVGPEGVSVYLIGHTDFENETEEIYLQTWLRANVVGLEGVSVNLVGDMDFENESEPVLFLPFK